MTVSMLGGDETVVSGGLRAGKMWELGLSGWEVAVTGDATMGSLGIVEIEAGI